MMFCAGFNGRQKPLKSQEFSFIVLFLVILRENLGYLQSKAFIMDGKWVFIIGKLIGESDEEKIKVSCPWI